MNATNTTLAILGGTPAFHEPLHVGRPNVGDRAALLRRIDAMLDRRWFTNDGPLVREFEQRVASILGVRHCVAMCNATVALEIATRALNMRDEVLTPSYTFIATAHALQWQGIRPVFCDIGPATHNLDPSQLERRITPKTTGIVGVHLWGYPCDTEAIDAVARKHGLPVVYDAAHAFGNTHRGRTIGSFGSVEVFSFHATKFVNCFEGGAACTHDDELAQRMRLMRNFGFQGAENVSYVGANGKMSEPCAAMGLTSLESLDQFIAVNLRNHAAYSAALGELPGLTVMPTPPGEKFNAQYVVVDVDAAQTGLSRDDLVAILWCENVRARRYYWPGCHRMEPYRTDDPDAGRFLPHTERVSNRVMVLPTGTAVHERDIATIRDILCDAIDRAPELRSGPLAGPRSQGPCPVAFGHPLDSLPPVKP